MKEAGNKKIPHKEQQLTDASRRDFLRKSVYAVYATPIITTLLIERANAAASQNNPNCLDPDWAAAHPGVCGPKP
jgi:hypothetical protein